MTEEPLDLRRSLRLLSRRWRTVVALFVAGLACGALVTVLRGPTFEARSGVLLPPSAVDASGRPLRNMLTETRIARSAEVLGPVGRALAPPVPASRLAKQVDVTAVGSDILEIRARSRSARQAATIANGVAQEYVNFSISATAEKSDTSITVLRDTAAALESQIVKLEADIVAGSARLRTLANGSPEAVQQAALIDSQRAAQVDATRQRSALDARVAEAQLNTELTRRGLRILEPATTPDAPWRRPALMRIGAGGTLGLVGGVLLTLYVAQRDRRLRRRDEIALAAGLPVLASLAVTRPKRVDQWRYLLEQWTPSASERLVLRQAFTRMGTPHKQMPTNVAVVTLAGDVAALALAVELAAFSADFGIPTRLNLAVRDRSAAKLRSACVLVSRSGARARPHLRVVATADGTDASDEVEADVTITIAAVDGDKLSVDSLGLRTTTVLAISSGFATGDALAAAILACEDQEQRVAGVLLANPEPDDHTMGTVAVSELPVVGGPPSRADAPPAISPPLSP